MPEVGKPWWCALEKGYGSKPEARDALCDGGTLLEVRTPLTPQLKLEAPVQARALLLQCVQPHLHVRQERD